MTDHDRPAATGASSLLKLLAPFTFDTRISREEMRERLVLAIVSLIGGPMLVGYGIQDLLRGQAPMAPALAILCGLILGYCFLAVRRRPVLIAPRLLAPSLALLLCMALYLPNDRLLLTWMTIMPMILTFLFGLREGLTWALLYFLAFMTTLTLPELFGNTANVVWPNTGKIVDFTVTYTIVTACAFGYEWLRTGANATAARVQTQLRAALADGHQSEERLRDFTETASDWLFELDANLRITHISGQWEALTGMSAGAVIGRSALDSTGGWQTESGEELASHLQAREAFRDVNVVMRDGDGRRLHLSVRGNPIFDADGVFAGYRAVGSDVTARSEAELELREKNRALQQASKMEAVGQLTSGVAHDFNNLLTVIMGNLELLEMRLDDANMDTEELDEARSASSSAADLTRKLLAFSRRQSLSPERVAMTDLIASTVRLLTRTLPEPIRIETRVPTNIWASNVDRSQLENALLNLALNARDAIKGAGRIDLSAENLSLDAEAGAEYQVDAGDYVRISVRDTGIGIPDEMLDHVFEPFFSTKPAGQGTGLGLSMVYGFVRQSGGGVRALSKVDVGTTIELVLPRSHDETPAARASASARPALARQGRGRPVLVIEDEPAVRNLVVSMLTRLGYSATAASSGEEGVERFRREPAELVISDVVLAGELTGVDAIRAIREIQPDVPALFMSGYSEAVFKDQRQLPEGVGLLAKPFGIGDLETRLRKLEASVGPSGAGPGEDEHEGD